MNESGLGLLSTLLGVASLREDDLVEWAFVIPFIVGFSAFLMAVCQAWCLLEISTFQCHRPAP
jgi:hypothetical protein